MIFECKQCNLIWYYPIKKCIYCKGEVGELKEKKFEVKGITEILIPSKNHPQTPYYVLFLEDENGNFHIKKSFEKQKIGDVLLGEKEDEKLKEKIGIVGAGVMGTGIAQVFLSAGFPVVMVEKNREFLDVALRRIKNEFLNNLNNIEKNKILQDFKATTSLNDLKFSGFVVEAITENLELKKQLFAELDKILGEETIITTNTSSLSIDELAPAVSRPERFAGVHFFNPPTKMNLVEIVCGKKTSKATVDKINSILKQINKIPIITKDSPCFIVNRIMIPFLNEASWEFYEGVAAPEDIDKAIRLGLNHPIGPLALMDLIGLDVILAIMNSLYQRTKNEKYLPCPIIEKMVKAGKLGRKTKEGFYKY